MADRSVTIRLRVASAEFDAAMARAGISVEALAAEVKAAGAAAGDGGKGLDDLGKKAKGADSNMGGLVRTAITLGPALIPLAGYAAAFGGGLLAAGATGILAFKGIGNEIKAGTQLGVDYRAKLQVITGDLHTLEKTAAGATLDGFQRSAHAVHLEMPELRREVQIFGRDLGDIGAKGIGGLVGGFRTFTPLLDHALTYADALAGRFEHWATGPGGEHFARTLGDDFDRAVPDVEHLVEAVGHLLSAFSAGGGIMLHTLGTVADLLNKIPLPVLTALATTFVAINAQKGIADLFGKAGGGLKSMAAESALAGSSVDRVSTKVGGLVSGVGKLAGAGLAIYTLGSALSNYLERNNAATKALDNFGSANSSFYNSLVLSKGAVDAGSTSAVQYQLQQDKLTEKAAKAGISQQQLTTAITGTDAQTQALIATWKASGDPSGDTIFSLSLLHKQYQDNTAAAKAYVAELDRQANTTTWGALNTTSDSLQQVADKYHLTTAQVQSYASMLGITKDNIDNGTVSNKQLADSVATVTRAYNTASVSGTQFLQQLQAFSQSTGTAADRAALIGAILKAANGDALAYGGAIAGAYDANHRLVASFQSEHDNIASLRKQISGGKLDTEQLAQAHKDLTAALDSSQRAAINLKDGTIDYTKQGAVPLIQGLQQVQDASVAAASAQYQHNRALGVDGKAAADQAYNTYVSQTRGALMDEATQLGLTRVQAKRFADEYFGIADAPDIKKKIEAAGADPLLTVLNKIGAQLAILTGHPWNPKVGADTKQAQSGISGVNDALHGLHGKTLTVGADTHAARTALAELNARINSMRNQVIEVAVHTVGAPGAGGAGRLAQGATGGTFTGDSFRRYGFGGTVPGSGGPKADDQLAWLSTGEEVTPEPQASKHRGLLKLIAADRFAAGGTVGGISHTSRGWTYGGIIYSTENAAINAQTRAEQKAETKADKPRDVTVSKGNVDGIISGIRGAIPGSVTAMRDLNRAVDAEFRLQGMHTKLDAAREKLTQLRQTADQFGTDTSNALRQGFDPTKAGTSTSGILRSFARPTANADLFATEFKQLTAAGLDSHYLQEFARAGGGSTFDALAKIAGGAGGRGEIAQVNQAYRGLQTAVGTAGSTAETAIYGKAIAAQTKNVNSLASLIHSQAARIDRLVAQVAALSKRPVLLELDGKVVASSVGKSTRPRR